MKRFTALLMCLFVFLFTSCTGKEEFYDLAICGSYAVPGMFCNELKGGIASCDVIERDGYGRVLFEYKTYSSITNQDETVYVICQKYDSKYVYFYEDIGYTFVENCEWDPAQLKFQNDWNEPLDETKISRRKNAMTSDLHIVKATNWKWSETEKACAEVLGINPSKIQPNGFVDCDANGNEITLIQCDDEQHKAYFVMTRTDGTASVLEITDQTLDQTQLTAWKRECGWVYGFTGE